MGPLAETTEVDHALDPLRARHPGERQGGCSLPRCELLRAAPAHRVDQVVGRVDSAARPAQRLGTQHVALVEVEAVALERASPGAGAIAHQAAHAEPRAASRAASRPPMNPVAPVTRTLELMTEPSPTSARGCARGRPTRGRRHG